MTHGHLSRVVLGNLVFSSRTRLRLSGHLLRLHLRSWLDSDSRSLQALGECSWTQRLQWWFHEGAMWPVPCTVIVAPPGGRISVQHHFML